MIVRMRYVFRVLDGCQCEGRLPEYGSLSEQVANGQIWLGSDYKNSPRQGIVANVRNGWQWFQYYCQDDGWASATDMYHG